MRLRTILIYSLPPLLGLAAGAEAQDSPGKRLAGVVAVAVSEYHLGVGPKGGILSQTELDEAREFFTDARDVAKRVTGPNAPAVRAIVDSLADAVTKARPANAIDSIYLKLTRALGADAILARGSRHPDADAGRVLFNRSCAQCHGAKGLGDGVLARGLTPAPAVLAGDSARSIPASLMYRVISVGVKGTAMPAWGDSLSADQRWDVVAYVSQLRAGGAGATSAATRTAREARAVANDVTVYLDSAMAAVSAGRVSDASDGAFDAYAAFEPLESLVRPRDQALVSKLEGAFLRFSTAAKRGDARAAGAARSEVLADLPLAVKRAAPPESKSEAFAMSLLIILREGFEAILIIGAIVAMLVRSGNAARVRDVWLGAAIGVLLSALTAFALQETLSSLAVNPEVLEGVTLLVAVVVLFSVSYWVLSKVEADKWRSYVRTQVDMAIGRGGRATLMAVSFLVVYREGAETALFFQPLLQRGSSAAPGVFGGIAAGAAALVAIYIVINRFGVRLPLRPFFAVTGALLYGMAMVFMGKGIRELQEGGVLPTTPLVKLPTIDAIGLYPSLETLAGQGLLLTLFLIACWYSFLRPATIRQQRSRAG